MPRPPVSSSLLPPRRGARARATALALSVTAALGCTPATPDDSPRQAILIVVDTLRRDALGCYGAPGDPTPNIDAFAATGTRFEQAISASGWTLPSMASILTASWPSEHKALGKKVRLTPITPDLATGPELLAAAGVATCAIANAAFVSPLLGLERGFELFDHEPAFNDRIRRADASVDAALAMVHERRDGDFFLLLHLFDPHLDYDAPDGYAQAFVGARREPPPPLSMRDCLDLQRAGGRRAPSSEDIDYVRGHYLAEVAFVDRALGRLFDGLREMGVYEQAWIALTADHGEEFWEHRGFEHGHSLYDELVRVPLVVRPPATDESAPPARLDVQVRTLDLMPTILAHFDLAFDDPVAGEPLDELLRVGDGADRPAWLEGTLYGSDRSGLRGSRYKYIRSEREDGAPREELYDWRTDPGESEDLAAREPAQLARLRAEFDDWRTRLDARAATLSTPSPEEIRPESHAAIEESLKSLGYTGRDEDAGVRESDDEARETGRAPASGGQR